MHSSGVNAPSVDEHPSGSPLPELARAITAGAVRLAAATAAWLRLIADFDERGGWHGYGITSCGHWLAWQCGLSPGAAREHVRVARALRGLPQIQAAFAAGRLSYSKVRALTRIAEPDSEASLLELATQLTASQTERTVRQWRRADPGDSHARHREAQSFEFWWDETGMLTLTARLPTEQGAALMAAIESLAERDARRERALANKGRAVPASDEPRRTDEDAALARERITARRITALASLAEAAADADRRAGDPPRREVVVHVDGTVLADDAAAGKAYIEGGPALSAAQARRMLCEATVVTSLERDRQPLAWGRRKRRATKAQRSALVRRDGGCAGPGCTETRIERLHVHHMTHWLFGGRTDLANLVLLCDRCHGLVHDQDLILSRRGKALVAVTPDGQQVWGPADAAFTGGLASLDPDRSAGDDPVGVDGVHVRPAVVETGGPPGAAFSANAVPERSAANEALRRKRDRSSRPGPGRQRSRRRSRRRSGRVDGRPSPAEVPSAMDDVLFPGGVPAFPDEMPVTGERMDVRYVVGVLMGNRDLLRRLAAESGAAKVR